MGVTRRKSFTQRVVFKGQKFSVMYITHDIRNEVVELGSEGGVNRPETGKRHQKCVFLRREKLKMFLFSRKKTQKKYDTGFSSCPNSPKLRSIHPLVAGRSGCRGSCVHPVGPPESH